MVERCLLPRALVMARFAFRALLPLMLVVLLMAGIAVCWSVLIAVMGMTVLTGNG